MVLGDGFTPNGMLAYFELDKQHIQEAFVCQVDGRKAGKVMGSSKGVYVGESSRSLYERGREHQKD